MFLRLVFATVIGETVKITAYDKKFTRMSEETLKLHNGFRNGYLSFRLINSQFMGGVYIHVSTPLCNQLAVWTNDIMW